MEIEFLLNGETVLVSGEPATRTLLEWLRETRGLKGTKEGCNEGDCGACTVMVSSRGKGGVEHKALNACILFLPQLHGKSVRTVEGLAGPGDAPHPVQEAMVEHHASQCGFCTPGIAMSLATAHLVQRCDHDDVLAGNLCRCTGYAPIIRAARAAAARPVPGWIADEPAGAHDQSLTLGRAFVPRSADDLANWYADNPDATLVAGATDVGLWVTKRLSEPQKTAFIGQIDDLRSITENDTEIRIGAAVTIEDMRVLLTRHHADFADMLRRFASLQVRNAATIGGNIANGSPIGDTPPALIALAATLHLRRRDERRAIALEDYFVAYGKQDRAPGEFVEAVSIPRQADNLKCHKVSKRFDQDISAVCGCFNISVTKGEVGAARIAYGGMAATPKRARTAEAALIGKAWNDASVADAAAQLTRDFTPIDDMRASAAYRLEVARNLLHRCYLDSLAEGPLTRVQGVIP
ncbi:MAG: xanthine dehydrogenase small subunit [Paracoccaceae bacterium]